MWNPAESAPCNPDKVGSHILRDENVTYLNNYMFKRFLQIVDDDISGMSGFYGSKSVSSGKYHPMADWYLVGIYNLYNCL